MSPATVVPNRRRGLSIVEFMVGVAVGLFVVGGAVKLFSDYIVSNKRLMLETRVNQELRAAADIIVRDIRRAGYWGGAASGVCGAGSCTVVPNPFVPAAASPASAASAPLLTISGNQVTYWYDRAASSAGFERYTDPGTGVDVLRIKDGTWQAITDPGTVRITDFTLTPSLLTNDISSYCNCLGRLTCTPASIAASGVPSLVIESVQLVITGQAVGDPAISRTLRETVRVRNPRVVNSCPP